MEEYTSRNENERDEDIILPAEKKVTLEPIHDDVHVDDESDIQIAASHANGAPIGNIASDRESTAIDNTAEPTLSVMNDIPRRTHAEQQPKRRKHLRSIFIMAAIIAALLFALLFR